MRIDYDFSDEKRRCRNIHKEAVSCLLCFFVVISLLPISFNFVRMFYKARVACASSFFIRLS